MISKGINKMNDLIEILLEETNNLESLFHISFNGNLPNTLFPRQPEDSNFKKKKTSPLTEDLPNRVSFSPSIQQCFSAIYPNVSKYFEELKYPYMTFFVYSPIMNTGKKLKRELVYSKVWDAHFTEEECFYTKVDIRKVAKINILRPNDNNQKDIVIHPFNDTSLPKRFVSPTVKFKITEQYESNISII